MIPRAHIVLLLLMAAAAPAKSRKPAPNTKPTPRPSPIPPQQPTAEASAVAVKEATTIALDAQRADKIYRVRTAIGYPAYVEFPEAFKEPPACGDCGKNGLFQMAVFEEGHYFAIKPAKFPGAQPDGTVIQPQEFVTNVNVRLVSGLTVTVQVELADNVRDADAKVVFTLPNRGAESAYVQQQIAAARRQLESEAAERAKAGAQQRILEMLAAPHQCSAEGGHARNANVVLEVTERCRFGTHLFLKFRVENRGSDLFSIGNVSIVRVAGKVQVPIDDASHFLTAQDLSFDGNATGVIGFDGSDSASSYQLRVTENGGQGREVTLDDLHF